MREDGAGKEKVSQKQGDVLAAVVEEFIATAQPVGSGQVASRYSLGVKAAMVRNTMAELAEAGYLSQPHTSAGRVPTDKAFRYYVDRIMERQEIAFADRAQIELHYSGHRNIGDLDDVMRQTSRLLALLTGQAALVTAPLLEATLLERVSFVRLSEKHVLAIFVAATGGIQNRLVDSECDYSQAELDRMACYLNDSLHHRTLGEARTWIAQKLREERASYDRFAREALYLAEPVASLLKSVDLYVDGSTQAIEQPEFSDHNRLRVLFRALEDKSALLDLLESSLKQNGPTVSIGAENYDSRLSEFSIVAASYRSGSTPLGSLAVLGPLRMDYQRVIPLVGYTARALSRMLNH